MILSKRGILLADKGGILAKIFSTTVMMFALFALVSLGFVYVFLAAEFKGADVPAGISVVAKIHY